VGAFFAMAAVGGGCRASKKAERWRDEQAAVHVVKKAAQRRAKRPRSRKAPRHPSGVEPVELVGLSPW
jgi:hypothetical protein